MCGIVGIVHSDPRRPVDDEQLMRVRDLMTHRGPDDAGCYRSGSVGFGHRRLAIIDLVAGHQPMSSSDGTLWIVFNGEIYNYRTLREQLVARGHTFRTSSDTEVILQLYAEEGARCARLLNGIFAFAIWDTKRQSLLLARDHMGVKPLYYAQTREALVFASEPKAIIASGYLEARIRSQGVFEYFVFRHLAGEHTLLDGVQCLPPAHTLVLTDGVARMERYWTPEVVEPPYHADLESSVDALDRLLNDAVRAQLVSDVPLGTFCSGGVDSSLITALAARATSRSINTFSVGFREQQYDETTFARLVSSHCRTTHHEIRISNREFADLLPALVWHNDAPLNFANSVQIYAVSKLAKQFVSVVLTGEGADELFCGYPRYRIPALAAAYRRIPGFMRRIVGVAAALAGEHRVDKLELAASRPAEHALLLNASAVAPEFAREVLMDGDYGDLALRAALLQASSARGDAVTRLSMLDQHSYLVSILERQDKMSMAASVEARVPFLDPRVVEFANGLPLRYKIRGAQTKAILKQVARRYVPEPVVARRKSGFGVPLCAWLRETDGLGRYLDELGKDQLVGRYLRKERVKEIVAEHRSGARDHSEFLWTAINFMMWTKSLPNQV